MEFNLKQWRNQSEHEEHQESPQKLPKLSPASSALPLFVPEPTTTLSAFSSHNTSTTKFPRMGSYFSLAQWQELELQALIFRYMISGAAVPHELLLHVKKSLISSPSTPYYICNPLHQYYSQNQPSLLQSGCWGKAAVDPEPGRCRRTDGKKWRCSRDVVAGQKYCERHMHRGRNRSRKPVEIPTSTTGAAAYSGNGGGGDALKTNHSTTQETANDVNGGLPGHLSSSMDLHLNRRPLDSLSETKYPFESQNNGDRTLRHFFDDWPKSLQETDNATNLSISMPENLSSDFSLKLGTGNGDEFRAQIASCERERTQPSWGTAWDTNRVAPMGGPLAEALRSSTTTSPTSVLHRLSRSSASEASFVSS